MTDTLDQVEFTVDDPVAAPTTGDDVTRVEPLEAVGSRRRAIRRDRRVLVVAGLLGAAVAVAAWLVLSGGSDSRPDDILVIDEAGTVSLLDVETGTAVFGVPDAVVTPDRSAILTTESTVSGTVIESRDPSTGEVTGTTSVVGDLEIRTVSPEGDAIALMAPRPAALGLYEPESRTTSEITIAFTDDRPAVRYALEGNYEPEVFSLDAATLYLLQFEPATEPDHYLVRELDVETGLVEAVKSPQVDIQPEMRGVARAQAIAPDGSSAYTLYTLPPDADPIHDVSDTAGSERWAFVHVLDLDEGFDFCIFLPVPMGTVNEANLGIGLSPDGRTLYVVDPSNALVARIDTESLEITHLYEVPGILDWTERPEVAVADNGNLIVGLGPDVLQLWPSDPAAETPSMTANGGWTFNGPATGLGLTADNRYLRLAADDDVIVIDLETSLETAVLTPPHDGDGGGYEILGPPSGNVTRIPWECAC